MEQQLIINATSPAIMSSLKKILSAIDGVTIVKSPRTRKHTVAEDINADPQIIESIEWRQMMSGEPYYAPCPALVAELRRVRRLVKEYNDTDPGDTDLLDHRIRALLGSCGKNITVNQPFRCDYGANIHVGENFFANFNLTILDEGAVTIGDNAFIGPNVSIYTACHPLDPEERNKGIEWSLPVTIGHNCWIGGNATILPGVTIGDNATIGAGSVVTKDVPSGEVWAGNPARRINCKPHPGRQ